MKDGPLDHFARRELLRAQLISRGSKIAAVAVRDNECLELQEFAGLLGVSDTTIANYLAGGLVIGLELEKRLYFPPWQFEEGVGPYASIKPLMKRAHGKAWDLFRVLTAKDEQGVQMGVNLLHTGQPKALLDYVDQALPE